MSTPNPAKQWLDGEISAGKMIQLAGNPHDLVGMIHNTFDEKVSALDEWLRGQIDRAERDYDKADELTGELKSNSKAAEAARKHAMQEARSMLRFLLLSCIENTQAGVNP